MNGQLQFGGLVPFTDHGTGQQVQVRVWGIYAGQGVDAHEEQAIQQWIMNALATSAASYQGNVHELPAKAGEWGQWVSQQIAPGLAQAFQAHGQLHIQGVQIEGGAGGGYDKSGGGYDKSGGAYDKKGMGGAPMAAAAAMSGGAPMAGGGGKADVAAMALMKDMGMSQDQAHRAAQIVIAALSGGGAAAMGAAPGHDPYAKKGGAPMGQPDPYAKKAADPYAQKAAQPDPYAKKPADPYAQKGAQPDPYAKKAADPYAQKGAPDPYAKKDEDPYKKKY
ncbi:MAG: hypothetical protein H6719_12050 [Sandaracinaceae bacterium]|nr:hypothetical protein [Sandaracinaceae bacterium]